MIFIWTWWLFSLQGNVLSYPNTWIHECMRHHHFLTFLGSHISPGFLLTLHISKPFLLHLSNDLFIATFNRLSSEVWWLYWDVALLFHLSLIFFFWLPWHVTFLVSLPHSHSLTFSLSFLPFLIPLPYSAYQLWVPSNTAVYSHTLLEDICCPGFNQHLENNIHISKSSTRDGRYFTDKHPWIYSSHSCWGWAHHFQGMSHRTRWKCQQNLHLDVRRVGLPNSGSIT